MPNVREATHPGWIVAVLTRRHGISWVGAVGRRARGSAFVAEEIEVFARARGAGAIIPVLVRGVPNNELRSGQEGDAAFPDALVAALRMPLAVDYRSFTVGKHKFTKPEG